MLVKSNVSLILNRSIKKVMFLFIKGIEVFIKAMSLLLLCFFVLPEKWYYFLPDCFYMFIDMKNLNTFVFFLICVVLVILVFLFFIPLDYGFLYYFSSKNKIGYAKITDVFYYYRCPKFFLKTVLFYMAVKIKIFYYLLIFAFLPVGGVLFFCIKMKTANENIKFLFSLAVIISLLILFGSIMIFFKKLYKCIKSPLIQIDNNQKVSWLESIFKGYSL